MDEADDVRVELERVFSADIRTTRVARGHDRTPALSAPRKKMTRNARKPTALPRASQAAGAEPMASVLRGKAFVARALAARPKLITGIRFDAQNYEIPRIPQDAPQDLPRDPSRLRRLLGQSLRDPR